MSRTGLGRFVGRPWTREALGVAWVLVAAAAVVAPLLRPGVTLGPFDLLSHAGLTHRTGVRLHNAIDEDQILQFVPWSTLAWRQVHSGHLPLWDPYNVLGTPLAFNWQSAVFSPPNLLSYLFPLRYAYTVIVVAKLAIAGVGAYFTCRVLRLGVLASAFGAVTFELSGPMLDRYGWAMTGVTMWSGWIFAAVWLLLRGRHRLRDGALLAVFLALAVYGGHPESLAVLAVTLVVFVAICVWTKVVPEANRWRAVSDLGSSVVAAAILSAPLLLPGLQLASGSARSNGSGEGAFALSHLPNLLVSGLQGGNYRDAAYVGVIAVVLALVGVAFDWRRRSVKAFAAVGLVSALLTFTPIDSAIQSLPVGRLVTWNRAAMILSFALAILAAFGMQVLLRTELTAKVRKWLAAGFAGSGVVLLAVWAASAASAHSSGGSHTASLVGPAVDTLAGLAIAGALWARSEKLKLPMGAAALLLLGLQTVYLAASGASFWSESSGFFEPTPAVTSLQHAVGNGLVALGSCKPIRYELPATVSLGISPNANIGYGVREFAVYDVMVPHTYARSWHAASGQQVETPRFTFYGIFCPAVTTVEEARIYGIDYVLEPLGSPGPSGAVFDVRVGDEELFRIPQAAEATLVSFDSAASQVPASATGTAVEVTHPGPASWRLHVDVSSARLLRLRLTAVPGWSATVDGRPLRLSTWAGGAMLEARLPAGSHTVDLEYRPVLFTVGIWICAAVVAAFVILVAFLTTTRNRRRRTQPVSHP